MIVVVCRIPPEDLAVQTQYKILDRLCGIWVDLDPYACINGPNNPGWDPVYFPITNYTLVVFSAAGDEYSRVVTDGSSVEYTVQGLEHSTAYYFKVSANNSIGESVMSNQGASLFTLGEPEAPESPTFSHVDLSSVNVSWVAPYENKVPIDRYQLLLADAQGLKNEVWLDPSSLDLDTTYDDGTPLVNSAGALVTVLVGDGLNTSATTDSNFAQRLSGYLVPTQTGVYTFMLITHGNAQVHLSSDDESGNLELVLDVTNGMVAATARDSSLNWTAAASTSGWSGGATLNLVAGSVYYLQVLHSAVAASTSATPALQPFLAVGLSWQPVDSTEVETSQPISDSLLFYSKPMSTDFTNVTLTNFTDVAGAVRSTVVGTSTPLLSGQAYRFKLMAGNDVGWGPMSPDSEVVVMGATKPSVPIAPEVDNSTKTNSSLMLQWSAPADNGAVITSYRIRMKEADGTVVSTTEIDATANFSGWLCRLPECGSGDADKIGYRSKSGYEYSGLLPGTEYKFQVAAFNAHGWSAYSTASVAQDTLATVPSTPESPNPFNLTATLSNATNTATASVQLKWTAPRDNGRAITTYHLAAWPVTACSSDTHILQVVDVATAVIMVVGDTSWYTVTMEGLEPGREYRFVVKAANILGYGPESLLATATNSTMLSTEPSSPAPPVATDPNSTRYNEYDAYSSVKLTWARPAPNGQQVAEYIIRRKLLTNLLIPHVAPDTDFGSPLRVNATGGDGLGCDPAGYNQSYTVEMLLPGQMYSFTVSAVNGEGESATSAPSNQALMEGYAPNAPGLPMVVELQAQLDVESNIASASVSLNWTAPGENGLSITRYRLRRRLLLSNQTSFTAAELNAAGVSFDAAEQLLSNATSTEVDALLPGRTYEFTVSAVNDKGESAVSPLVRTDMLSTVPSAPDAPSLRNPSISNGEHRMEIHWTAPAPNGQAVTGYRVERMDDGRSGYSGFYDPVVLTSSATSTRADELTGSTPYRFRVAAINSIGTGPFSNASEILWTSKAPPSTPNNPFLSGADLDSLSVSWVAPRDNGAAITGYLLTYRPFQYQADVGSTAAATTYTGSKQTVTVGNILQWELTGLAEGSAYEVSVAANNSRGVGDYSSVKVLSTLRPLDPCSTGVLGTSVGVVTTTGSSTTSTSVHDTSHCSVCAAERGCGWCEATAACLSGHALGPYPSFDCPASSWRFSSTRCGKGIVVSKPRLFLSEGPLTSPTPTPAYPTNSISYTLTLLQEPSAPVTVTLTFGTDLIVSPAVLVFSGSEWATPQEVTIQAVDDRVEEAGRESQLITHFANSSDMDYYGPLAMLNASTNVTELVTGRVFSPGEEVEVYLYDDDTAAVVLSSGGASSDIDADAVSMGELTLVEGTTAALYTVSLQSQPIKPVMVTMRVQDTVGSAAAASSCTVSPTLMVFTSTNWSTAQHVSVRAEADLTFEHSASDGVGYAFVVITHAAESADTYYSHDNVNFAPVSGVMNITVLDSLAAGPALVTPHTLKLVEAGHGSTSATSRGAYNFSLQMQPTDAVTVEVLVAAEAAGWVVASPSAFVFTPTNWTAVQTVWLTVVDDEVAHDLSPFLHILRHECRSDDQRYNDTGVAASAERKAVGCRFMPSSTLLLEVVDQDQAGVLITPVIGSPAAGATFVSSNSSSNGFPLHVTESCAAGDSNLLVESHAQYKLVLTSRPLANVTITARFGTSSVGGSTSEDLVIISTSSGVVAASAHMSGSANDVAVMVVRTPYDWDTPVFFNVTATADLIDEGLAPETHYISHSVSSADWQYNSNGSSSSSSFVWGHGRSVVPVSAADCTGVVRFSHAEVTASESSGSAVASVVSLQLQRQSGRRGDILVNFSTVTDGAVSAYYSSAVEGVDYERAVGVLTMAEGTTSATVNVTILDDHTYETAAPTFNVSILSVSYGASIGDPASARVFVSDDGDAGVVGFDASQYYFDEFTGEVSLRLVRVTGFSRNVSVDYRTVAPAAASAAHTSVAGEDFVVSSGTVHFAEGVTESNLVIGLLDNLVYEAAGQKHFLVVLANATGGARVAAALGETIASTTTNATLPYGEARVDVLDNGDAGVVRFASASGYSFSEDEGLVQLTLVRMCPNASGTRSVGADSCFSGNISVGFDVLSGGALGSATASGSAAAACEDDGAGGSSHSALDPTTGHCYRLSRVRRFWGQAQAECTAWKPGAMLASIGSTYENTFVAQLLAEAHVQEAFIGTSDNYVYGGSSSHTISSREWLDETGAPMPTPFTIPWTTSDHEPSTGLGAHYAVVSASDYGGGWRAANDDSLAFVCEAEVADLRGESGVVHFADGQRNQTLSVLLYNDLEYEPVDENFTVRLRLLDGDGAGEGAATVGVSLGTVSETMVTITDDGDCGMLSFTQAELMATEAMGYALLTVTRSGGANGQVAVALLLNDSTLLQNATAKLGEDYSCDDADGCVLVLADGQRQGTLNVSIARDGEYEPVDEWFVAGLAAVPASSGIASGNIVATTSLKVTIRDADEPCPTEFYSPILGDGAPTPTPTTPICGGHGVCMRSVCACESGYAGVECDPVGYVEFDNATTSVNEDVGFVVLTVVRKGGTAGRMSVHFSTSEVYSPSNGTAIAIEGLDFVFNSTSSDADGAVSKVVVFADGQVSASVVFTMLNDGQYELHERFAVTLLNASNGGSVGLARTAEVHVYDDGDAGMFEFSSSNYSAHEDAGQVTLTVNRVGGTSGVVTVSYNTAMTSAPSKATAISDYTPVSSGTITFADEQASSTLSIAIIDDGTHESPDEMFVVVLANATSGSAIGAVSSAEVTIVDDGDAGTFEFSASDYNVGEDAGRVVVTVNRVGGSSGNVSVAFGTLSLSAHGRNASAVTDAQHDFAHLLQNDTNNLHFADGQTSLTFAVDILDDAHYEHPDERFIVKLYGLRSTPALDHPDPTHFLSGATLGNLSEAWVTIVDDGDAGSFSFQKSNYSIGEADGSVLVTVMRSGGSSGNVSLSYTTLSCTELLREGNASHAGAAHCASSIDFTMRAGEVHFSEGQTSTTIAVSILNDADAESEEFFELRIFNATNGGRVTNSSDALFLRVDEHGGETPHVYASTTILIADDGDEGDFEFSSASFSVREDAGSVTVTVLRVGGASGMQTLNYYAVDGTAVIDVDFAYVGTSQSVEFADGVSSAEITMVVINNEVYSASKSFNIRFGAGGASSTTEVTITDDGDAGTFSFATAEFSCLEDAGTVDVIIRRDGGQSSAESVMVQLRTVDGTAHAGADFEGFGNSTLHFADNETEKTLSVMVVDDAEYESPDQYFTVRIGNVTGGASIGEPSEAMVTIVDDGDAGIFAFSASSYNVSEDAGLVALTVQRKKGVSGTASVTFDTQQVTALAGIDYTCYSSNSSSTNSTRRRLSEGADVGNDYDDYVEDGGEEGGEKEGGEEGQLREDGDVRDVRLGKEQGRKLGFTSQYHGPAFACSAWTSCADSFFCDFAVVEGGSEGGGGGQGEGGCRQCPFMEASTGQYRLATSTEQHRYRLSLVEVEVGCAAMGLTGAGEQSCRQICSRVAGEVSTEGRGWAAAGGVSGGMRDEAQELRWRQKRRRRLTGGGECRQTLTFGDQDNETLVYIQIVNDELYEYPPEFFQGALSEPTNGAKVLANGTTSVYILDDGDAGTFGFEELTYTVGEDRHELEIGVVRADGRNSVASEVVSVSFYAVHGEATEADFLLANGTLIFADQEERKTVRVSITDDLHFEGNETFQVVLHNPTGGARLDGTRSTVTVSIADERDVLTCDAHMTKDLCAGTGLNGTCCIWVLTGAAVTNATEAPGQCKGAAGGFTEMLCRSQLMGV
jgi:hypothetical protein